MHILVSLLSTYICEDSFDDVDSSGSLAKRKPLKDVNLVRYTNQSTHNLCEVCHALVGNVLLVNLIGQM